MPTRSGSRERFHRTDVNDRTAVAGRKHGPGLVLQTQEGPLQVRVENAVPFLLG